MERYFLVSPDLRVREKLENAKKEMGVLIKFYMDVDGLLEKHSLGEYAVEYEAGRESIIDLDASLLVKRFISERKIV